MDMIREQGVPLANRQDSQSRHIVALMSTARPHDLGSVMTHTHTCPTLGEKWFDGAMADRTFPMRNSRVARRKDLGEEGPLQWILGLMCGDFGGGPYYIVGRFSSWGRTVSATKETLNPSHGSDLGDSIQQNTNKQKGLVSRRLRRRNTGVNEALQSLFGQAIAVGQPQRILLCRVVAVMGLEGCGRDKCLGFDPGRLNSRCGIRFVSLY